MADTLHPIGFSLDQFIESLKKELTLYTEMKSSQYNFDFVNEKSYKPTNFEWEESTVSISSYTQ